MVWTLTRDHIHNGRNRISTNIIVTVVIVDIAVLFLSFGNTDAIEHVVIVPEQPIVRNGCGGDGALVRLGCGSNQRRRRRLKGFGTGLDGGGGSARCRCCCCRGRCEEHGIAIDKFLQFVHIARPAKPSPAMPVGELVVIVIVIVIVTIIITIIIDAAVVERRLVLLLLLPLLS